MTRVPLIDPVLRRDLIHYIEQPTRKREAFMLGFYARRCHVGNVNDANPFEFKSEGWYAWRRGYWAGDGRGNLPT